MTTQRTCSTCASCVPGENKALFCRWNPPQATIIMIPQQTLQGPQMIPQAMATWPPVEPDQWCDCWRPSAVIKLQ